MTRPLDGIREHLIPFRTVIAAVAGVLFLGALALRRRMPSLSEIWLILPGFVLVLFSDALLPRSPGLQAATLLFLAIAAALATVVLLFVGWRDPAERPAYAAIPLLLLPGPLAASNLLPARLDWSAVLVACAGAAVLWDGLRQWRTYAQPLGLRLVGLGLGAVWFGVLLTPAGPAPTWLPQALVAGALLAAAIAWRGYWLHVPE